VAEFRPEYRKFLTWAAVLVLGYVLVGVALWRVDLARARATPHYSEGDAGDGWTRVLQTQVVVPKEHWSGWIEAQGAGMWVQTVTDETLPLLRVEIQYEDGTTGILYGMNHTGKRIKAMNAFNGWSRDIELQFFTYRR
jgi:hypothetical protein